MLVDDESDSLIICDNRNKRVVRWPRRNGTSAETRVGGAGCWGLTMDHDGSLYIVDFDNHAVWRHRKGQTLGSIVARGNHRGYQPDQLSFPKYAFIDRDYSVYVTSGRGRVMKWVRGAVEGTAVTGDSG